MTAAVYCSDCANWDTRSRQEFTVGLGHCKAFKTVGHFFSGRFPRDCPNFKPAPSSVVADRMRVLGE